MAKKTYTAFVCDWCGTTTPGIENGYSGAQEPDGWHTTYACSDCGTTGERLLCGECSDAMVQALDKVEAERKAART